VGGFFGVAADGDCVADLFYGTDYHSHLGTRRGGLAVRDGGTFTRFIHDISNAQFRSKFETDLARLHGGLGIGVISDYEDQPLLMGSHLGTYAIVTVGVIRNLAQLAAEAFSRRDHFSEMSGGQLNPTEVVAGLINQEDSFEAGIAHAQSRIEGSCSLLILCDKGIYAARDRFGRTPVLIGVRPGAIAATFESCAFPNLGYAVKHVLGPGEVVFFNADGFETRRQPGPVLQICSFLWVYYGYPASSYEGINVENTRYRCGAMLAQRDATTEVDLVCGIPDSGTAHAQGYANARGLPYKRPYVKYTPTWPRSFMPPDQRTRELVARMKLIPIPELIRDQRMLFCEDSIVRGTQLRDTIRELYGHGAREVHMRPACPPLLYSCKFLNFSQSRSELDLATRRAIKELDGDSAAARLPEYASPCSDRHQCMVRRIAERLSLTTLRYQRLEDLVAAIGLPKEKLCTYCWDAAEPAGTTPPAKPAAVATAE
jgi:amidophosphoribosyltransferase